MVRAILGFSSISKILSARLLSLAMFALVGASVSSAFGKSGGLLSGKNQMAWQLTPPTLLPPVSVTLGSSYANPVYSLRMPDGEIIDLPSKSRVDLSGLSNDEIRDAAEHTRIILEGLARLFASNDQASYALVRGAYTMGIVPDQNWLRSNGYKVFDPIRAVTETNPFGASQAEVVVPPGGGVSSEFDFKAVASDSAGPQTVRERIQSLYTFFRDAVYTSTIKAFQKHRQSNRDMKGQVQEWGFQIALRGELQFGVGKVSYTRNFPVMFTFGYNREQQTIVFRRGHRVEKMADGMNILAGWKVEFRRYRLYADGADAADVRKNFSKITGTSWYPPSIPIFSPVFDSGPGYQSEGFAIGSSIQNIFLPETIIADVPFALLNTVTEFVETQRYYSARIPDAAAWMKRAHQRILDSGNFVGPAAGARCEGLFRPLPMRRIQH